MEMGLFPRQVISSSFILLRYYSAYVSRHTVYAVASGKGKCGVSVLRVSGPAASQALLQLCQFKGLPKARQAILRRIIDPKSNELLDKGIVIWFPGPASFTGEDCCEFHIHGGSAVVSSVMSALASIPHLYGAQPGDFTKRAFVSGKLDLTEVEGLADLINAETENQRRQAFLQMDGSLSNLYRQWTDTLLKCLAHGEAYIDFSEDDNLEDNIIKAVSQEITYLLQQICAHLNDNRRGERLRNGINTAIIGKPNVGKSTLLNTICQRPAAIVSPIAGTTRDVIDIAFDIGGYPVVFGDTAGLRESEDIIEQEGVKRAKHRADVADLLIVIVDAEDFDWKDGCTPLVWRQFIQNHLSSLGLGASINDNDTITLNIPLNSEPSGQMKHVHKPVLVVINKLDLIPNNTSLHIKDFCKKNQSCVAVSCETGYNINEFLTLLQEKVQELCGNPSTADPVLTTMRHRIHLESCVNHLRTFDNLKMFDLVLAAESLRLALRDLGKITGKITTEEVLNVIFKDFCIGK